jgi:hypothetical protein
MGRAATCARPVRRRMNGVRVALNALIPAMSSGFGMVNCLVVGRHRASARRRYCTIEWGQTTAHEKRVTYDGIVSRARQP